MKENLNQLVLEYKQLNENDQARKKVLLIKIVQTIYDDKEIKVRTKSHINTKEIGLYTTFESVIDKLIIIDKIIDKFNPENYDNNFKKYLYGCIKNETSNENRKNQKYINANSLDYQTSDDEGNYISKEYASNENLEEDSIGNSVVTNLNQVLAYSIIHFLKHKGKQYNSTKLQYIKMFYTESMTILFKDDIDTKDLNSQQIFSAMDTNFLDMYMKMVCRTPKEVRNSPLKYYSELFKDEPCNHAEIKLPLENRVFLKYWEDLTGKKIADSNISQQRNYYKTYMRNIIDDV